MAASHLFQLRSIVQDSLGKHMYENAIFFADKLVSLSHGSEDDVFLLCQAYAFTKQSKRALHLLSQTGLGSSRSARFAYLTAKCLAEAHEWDECLDLLTDDVLEEAAQAEPEGAAGERGHIGLHSSMLLLKGSVYEALENWPLAAKHYCDSLRAEPLNYEALHRLLINHMLSTKEQLALLAELEKQLDQSHLQWLRLYYACKLDPEMGQRLAALHEAAAGSEAQAPFGGSCSVDIVAPCAADDWRGAKRAAASRKSAAAAEAAAATAALSVRGGGSVYDATGLRLAKNCDLMIAAAEYEYSHDRFRRCYALSSRVLANDPYNLSILPIHVCSLAKLSLHSELFTLAHQLVEAYPQQAIPWFAVGCYYYMTGDFESARRYFSRATSLNHRFAPAWVGFGHAFAAQDESDQAMAAYRTATRLFPGSHTPWLSIGIEYLRTNHLPLAMQYVKQAHVLAPNDPHVLHELGVLHYTAADWENAAHYFLQVARHPGDYDDATREPSIFNLAHTYRKMKRLDEAIEWYRAALAIHPHSASTYSALGFTHHLRGDVDLAIELYHQSLSLKPDDTFTSEMLTQALKDTIDEPLSLLGAPVAPIAGLGRDGKAASAIRKGLGMPSRVGEGTISMDTSAA